VKSEPMQLRKRVVSFFLGVVFQVLTNQSMLMDTPTNLGFGGNSNLGINRYFRVVIIVVIIFFLGLVFRAWTNRLTSIGTTTNLGWRRL